MKKKKTDERYTKKLVKEGFTNPELYQNTKSQFTAAKKKQPFNECYVTRN